MRSPARYARAGLLLVAGLLVVAALAPASASAALGTTLTFKASADAFVTKAQPRSNFGRSELLEVARPTRSYIRFRVRGLRGRVSRALLLLKSEEGTASFKTRAARSNSWRERGITFANAPRLGRLGKAVRPRGDKAWVAADVTRLVKRNGQVTLVLTASGRRTGAVASRQQGRDAPRLLVQVGGRSDPKTAAAGNVACAPSDPNFNGGLGTAAGCRQQATGDLLAGMGLDAVFMLGDGQYFCGGYDAYQSVYDPAWGRVKAITHPLIGNHDVAKTGAADCDPSGGASGYFRYFGAAAGDPSKGYYSFDVGAWHVIALNTNCEVVGCLPGSAQQRWLQRDLARRGAPCTVALLHHPRYSSSYQSQRDPHHMAAIWRTLAAARVDLALAAHDHVYERFAPQNAEGGPDGAGVREFVVGTGGHSHHPFFNVQPNSQVRNNETFGVLRTSLRPTGYSWRFLPTAGGTFTDAGSATCH
jgi:hypothetical protein